MVYYTQVLFVIDGQEALFESFEDQALPFLSQYNGELIYRVRPPRSAVLATSFGYPYEIHLVSFPSRADFVAYRDNPQRLAYLPLKDQSIARVLLIEGKAL